MQCRAKHEVGFMKETTSRSGIYMCRAAWTTFGSISCGRRRRLCMFTWSLAVRVDPWQTRGGLLRSYLAIAISVGMSELQITNYIYAGHHHLSQWLVVVAFACNRRLSAEVQRPTKLQSGVECCCTVARLQDVRGIAGSSWETGGSAAGAGCPTCLFGQSRLPRGCRSRAVPNARHFS